MQNYFNSKKINNSLALFLSAIVFSLLAGCGDGGTVAGTTSVGANTTVATLQISGTPTTVKSDGSTTSLITVAAVSTTNSSVAGAVVTLVTDTGLLSVSTVTTDSTGKATLTFSSGTANKANRTATITATAGSASALLPVQIVGSTLAVSATSGSLQSSGASPVTMTVTAKDAGGTAIPGATVTLTQTGGATVTLTPSSGTTDASGKLSVSVAGAGVAAGTATVRAAAVGAMATLDFNVTVGTTFGINQVTLNAGTAVVPTSPKTTAMGISDSLAVQVAAPVSTSVIFATTIGTWVGAPVATPNVIAVAPAAGVATATLNTASAGVANV
ncbi:MAG TPA: Ig-like domain-containing protein [Gallionellaceae bacterium]|nr:Ig-like domain-containing protein [Gallionellaceae bacterium]